MRGFLKVVALTMIASVALWIGTTARAVMYFSPDSQDVTAVAWSPMAGTFFRAALKEQSDCGELTHVKVAPLSILMIHVFVIATLKMEMDLV